MEDWSRINPEEGDEEQQGKSTFLLCFSFFSCKALGAICSVCKAQFWKYFGDWKSLLGKGILGLGEESGTFFLFKSKFHRVSEFGWWQENLIGSKNLEMSFNLEAVCLQRLICYAYLYIFATVTVFHVDQSCGWEISFIKTNQNNNVHLFFLNPKVWISIQGVFDVLGRCNWKFKYLAPAWYLKIMTNIARNNYRL